MIAAAVLIWASVLLVQSVLRRPAKTSGGAFLASVLRLGVALMAAQLLLNVLALVLSHESAGSGV